MHKGPPFCLQKWNKKLSFCKPVTMSHHVTASHVTGREKNSWECGFLKTSKTLKTVIASRGMQSPTTAKRQSQLTLQWKKTKQDLRNLLKAMNNNEMCLLQSISTIVFVVLYVYIVVIYSKVLWNFFWKLVFISNWISIWKIMFSLTHGLQFLSGKVCFLYLLKYNKIYIFNCL